LRGPNAEERSLAHILNGTFFLVILLLFISFNNHYFQAQARYLLPAIGPIAGAFAVGLNHLLRARTYLALGIVVLVLGGVDVYALMRLPSEFERRTVDLMPSVQRANESELAFSDQSPQAWSRSQHYFPQRG
jgi:hypothetical protein